MTGGKELFQTNGYREISRLGVLIHPSFNELNDNNRMRCTPGSHFAVARSIYLREIFRDFIPCRSSQFVAVVTALDLRLPSWFRSFVDQSPFPDNILPVGNIVDFFEGDVFHAPDMNAAGIIFCALQDRGFVQTERTVLTVGGEYLNICVRTGVKALLALPQTREVRLDRNAVISNSRYPQLYDPETEEWQGLEYDFKHARDLGGFKAAFSTQYRIKEDKNYVVISKEK